MKLTLRFVAGSLIAAGAVFSASAPIALADPPVPAPGSEPPTKTIQDLRDQGYRVYLTWENTSSGATLERCWVTDIDTTGPWDQRYAYVKVDCPQ
jgi:hypothetical protein